MLLIAVALGYSVAGSLNEFEQFIEKVTLPDVGQRVVRLDQATEMIKTEFIRSRRHSRPLALLLVEPTSLSFEPELERAVRDIQEKMTERFVAANLAQVIANEARRTDVILSKDGTGRFVVLCPEDQRPGTVNLAERIQDDLVDKLGVSVAYGIASFPDEALTFEDLLKRAEFNLQNYVQIPEEKRTITNDSH
jgi:GGDEF domain-containing protein